MKIYSSIISIFFLLLILCSCDKPIDHTWKANVVHAIKDDVALISSVDLLTVLDKSDLINSSSLPDEYKVMSTYVQNTLKAENLGLKLEGNIHAVVVSDKQGNFDYLFFMADVVNAKKLGKNLKFLIGGKKEVDDFNFLTTNNGIVLGWDNDNLIGVLKNPLSQSNENTKAIVSRLLNLRIDKVSPIDNIDDYFNRKDDLNALILLQNYAKMTASLAGINLSSVANDQLLISGNFNAGSISFESTIFSTNINGLTFLKNQPLDPQYMNYLSDNGRLISFLQANLAMDEFINHSDFLTQYEPIIQEINAILSPSNLSFNDVKGLFNGEFSMSLIDFEVALEDELNEDLFSSFNSEDDDFFNDVSEDDFYDFYDNYDNEKNEVNAKFLFVFGIKNIDALIAIAKENNFDLSQENIIELDSETAILLKDNKLYLGNPIFLMQQIKSANSLATFKHSQTISSPVYGYINSDTTLMPINFNNYIKSEMGPSFYGLINQVKLVSFKGSGKSYSFDVELKNNSENSLKIIVEGILKSFYGNGPVNPI